jgi:hypothetical protein
MLLVYYHKPLSHGYRLYCQVFMGISRQYLLWLGNGVKDIK